MKMWVADEEFQPREIGDEHAAERFIRWLSKCGQQRLEDDLRAFVHAPWQCGGLGAALLDAPEDLDALRRTVLEHWEPVRAGR